MTETIARAVREDMFIVGHDPHRQFGDFTFQMKSPASIANNTTAGSITGSIGLNFGFNQQIQSSQLASFGTNNELAMYWNDTEIKEVGFGGLTGSDTYTNPNNIQILFKDFKQAGSTLKTSIYTDKDKTKTIQKLDMSTELYWRFGSDNARITISSGTIVNQEMTNTMSYIPIISDINGLVPIIQSGTLQSKFPYYVNRIDFTSPYDESVYLIPYVIYNQDSIQFGTALVTQLAGTHTYVADGIAKNINLTDEGSSNLGILSTAMSISITDEGHNGEMKYAFNDNSILIAATPTTVNTLVMTSYYNLKVTNTFELERIKYIPYYLDNNALV